MMKRREILKTLVLGSGAIVALPAWANAWKGSSITASGIFTKTQASVLSSIAGTFIPEGIKEPGAVGLEVNKYLDRLIADCYDVEDQKKVKEGIDTLEETATNTYKMTFSECTKGQRESMLTGFSEPSDQEKAWFYSTMRRETIRGYTTSEYVMVNYYEYVMAPGFYKGCVEV
jgi:hypothetical protein